MSSVHPRRILLVDDARLDVELALDAFRELQLTGEIERLMERVRVRDRHCDGENRRRCSSAVTP